MKIVTIIPAYNEEDAIKKVVKRALIYSDVVVINDGSSDLTSSFAKEAGAKVLRHYVNKGKGAAIKTGLEYAIKNDYEKIVLIDGDGQHDPNFVPQMVSGMDSVDLRIGSRFIGAAPLNMPFQRRLSNWITTNIMRYLTGYLITDSQSGFRVISSKSALLFLDIPYNDYIYESEMLYQASINNLILDEIPIQCTYSKEKSYVKTWHVLHYLTFTLRLLLNKLRRRIHI